MFTRPGLGVEVELALDPGSSQVRLVDRAAGIVAEHAALCLGEARSGVANHLFSEAFTDAHTREGGFIRPVRAGEVLHPDAAVRLFREILDEHIGSRRSRPGVLLAMPGGLDGRKQGELISIVREAGAREVFPVPASILAAWGCELPVGDPVGSLVLDVGSDKTTAALTSLGGLIGQVTERIGGRSMDEAIGNWVRNHMKLAMGRRTAEALKIRLAAAPAGISATLSLRGRDLETLQARQSTVAASGIASAMAPVNQRVASVVRKALAQAPPEVSADIAERGIMVCGGSAAVTGLTEALREVTGLAVVRAEQPQHAVARGAWLALRQPDILERMVELSP